MKTNASELAQTNIVHIVKIDKGTNVMAALHAFLTKKPIGFGAVTAIGMVKNVQLGFLKNDHYVWKTWHETVELTSLLGNIAWDGDDKQKPLIHLHAMIADENFQSFGGHFGDATVAAVVELLITEVQGLKIVKKHFGIVPFKTLDV